MKTKRILNSEKKMVFEQKETVVTEFKGLRLSYEEVFYWDYEVDEETGMIDKSKKVKYYTKEQMSRNLKSLKTAYMIEKGAASPNEIIEFRLKYKIAASTFSLILGFSKNTISNIEKEGISSLPTGRLIKMCLNNHDILTQYIVLCDYIDDYKKKELLERFYMDRV